MPLAGQVSDAMKDWADERLKSRGGPGAKPTPPKAAKPAHAEPDGDEGLSPAMGKALALLGQLAPVIEQLREEHPAAFPAAESDEEDADESAEDAPPEAP